MCRFWALRPRLLVRSVREERCAPLVSPIFIQKSIYESFVCISRVRVHTRASAVFRFFAFTLHPDPVSR